jgi:hypothetical protein
MAKPSRLADGQGKTRRVHGREDLGVLVVGKLGVALIAAGALGTPYTTSRSRKLVVTPVTRQSAVSTTVSA